MNTNFQQKLEEIRNALHEYIAYFEMNPDIIPSEEKDGPSKIPMNYDENEELARKHIVHLAKLLGPLRAAVPTWGTKDTQGSCLCHT
jgi:hypothetical protein